MPSWEDETSTAMLGATSTVMPGWEGMVLGATSPTVPHGQIPLGGPFDVLAPVEVAVPRWQSKVGGVEGRDMGGQGYGDVESEFYNEDEEILEGITYANDVDIYGIEEGLQGMPHIFHGGERIIHEMHQRDKGNEHYIPMKRRQTLHHLQVSTLESESDALEDEYFSSGKEYDEADIEDPNSIKNLYCDCIWNKTNFTYDSTPQDFIGISTITMSWRSFPTMLQLFDLFWTHHILRDTVKETNQYAANFDENGNTMGGLDWKDLTIPRLKAFMAAWLYMGMKHQPNIKSYWHKRGSIFHCPIISKVMT
jgi:hypothetical protein